jgi:NAD(P)-dependent dehydrogenase (short-subunit alcohol dehydrogenase family)
MNTLSGKTALVTGASRGIGRATALALARLGAQVLVHYGRSAAEAERLVAEIVAAAGRATAIGGDLEAPEGPVTLASRTRDIVGGRLDILVANAGVTNARPIEAFTVADFDSLFAVNVRAPFFLVQQLLPILGEGSSIVFVSSLAARSALPKIAAYASSKGAVETLTRHLAASLGERGIRVNAVAPGIVDTDMSNFTKTEEGRVKALRMQALQRIAEPGEIADVIAFAASPASRWITGQVLAVDGGSKL